jgi:murein endopeptidase
VAATYLTCASNRGYVRPEVVALIEALGNEVAQQFPGSRVTTLEGNFPFLDGSPLLPHLSHRDGRKVDVAYFYRSSEGSAALAHGSPSWLGYFIYEQPRQGDPLPCAGRWTPLRWNFDRFQPDSPNWRLDEQRTAWMLTWLKSQPQVARIFIEPHLAQRLGVAGGKVHFQGCQAARHDDHIHVEIF